MKNTQKQQYAVFIDIDGTLMGKNDDALFENLATIQKVRSLGHKVFISTGRAMSYIPKKLDHEKNFDGVITGAGAFVSFGKNVISKTLMPKDLVERFSRYVMENGVPGFLEGHEMMYHYGISYDANSEWFKGSQWTEITGENIKEILDGGIPIEKFSVIGTVPEELDEIMGETCTVLRFSKYGEVIQKSCGKAKALLDTANYLGILSKNTVAIGDSMNDFDMIEVSGIGVAMGNAAREVKEIADFITDDADNAGVATALKRIFCL